MKRIIIITWQSVHIRIQFIIPYGLLEKQFPEKIEKFYEKLYAIIFQVVGKHMLIFLALKILCFIFKISPDGWFE